MAVASKDHLQKSYNNLVSKLKESNNIKPEGIKFFSHVTTESNLKVIEQTLKDQSTVTLTGSRIVSCRELEGLWTTVSLNKDGKLHSGSPYGSKRLDFKIDDACENPDDWELFFEQTYPCSGGFRPVNQYIRLVLVKKEQQKELDWCINNLYRINLQDNPFFKMGTNEDVYPAFSNKCMTERWCRACGVPVKKCQGECKCRSCDRKVKNCRCEPGRKSLKLKLFVKVFIVGGIEYGRRGQPKVTNITAITRGRDIAPDSKFFA